VHTAVGVLKVVPPSAQQVSPQRERLTLAIRPEKVVFNPPDAETNCLRARVEAVVYNGAETQYLLRSGAQMLRACLMNASSTQRSLRIGDEITAHLPADGLILLED